MDEKLLDCVDVLGPVKDASLLRVLVGSKNVGDNYPCFLWVLNPNIIFIKG